MFFPGTIIKSGKEVVCVFFKSPTFPYFPRQTSSKGKGAVVLGTPTLPRGEMELKSHQAFFFAPDAPCWAKYELQICSSIC